MIREVKVYWEGLEKKKLTAVMQNFGLSRATAKKYIDMPEEELDNLERPVNYKKRESAMNAWLNVIYKMMRDGHSNETIYFYIKRQETFCASGRALAEYIYLLGKNNFPGRPLFNQKNVMEETLPAGVTCFKRAEILKYRKRGIWGRVSL